MEQGVDKTWSVQYHTGFAEWTQWLEQMAVERGDQPRVATLLDVDREYRGKAAANELRKIAPKRFNPDGIAWLPIMHIERDGWDMTALYSNTARAHRLGKTDDWVVVYYERDDREGQATVVTETSGPLEGKRVVRGREAMCQRHYSRVPDVTFSARP